MNFSGITSILEFLDSYDNHFLASADKILLVNSTLLIYIGCI